MERISADLAAEHAQLRATLVSLPEAAWQSPTRCPGWSVADVVLHLAQSDELAAASARGTVEAALAGAGWDLAAVRSGRLTVDAVAAAAVERQRGADPGVLLARWSAAADELGAALAAANPRRPLTWVIGELPARTLATTRLAECWIHAGDVAAAVGVAQPPSGRLWHIARLAWRTLPYAFARAGRPAPVGPIAVTLDGPDGSVWEFTDGDPVTTIRGDALTFCQVAARRLPGEGSGLHAEGPDAAAALELVRTFA